MEQTLKIVDVLILPVGILALAICCGFVLNGITNRYLHKAVKANTWQYIIVNATRGMALPLCIGIGLYWTIDSVTLPANLNKLFSYILFGTIVMSITHMVAKTVVGVIDFYTENSMENMPKSSLIDNMVKIFIYCNGILIILQYVGISIAPILTALGVGGMAVALSLQDTLANIFAGIHLILSKQVRINDYVRLSSGEEGVVTDIKWRFTTLLAPGNNVVIVPNQTMAKSSLTNFAMPNAVLSVKVPIGVSYDSDLYKVEEICLKVAKEVVEKVAGKENMPALVRYNEFADSSINFNVIIFVEDYVNQFELKHEYIKAVTDAFRKENIEIPFPIRTIINSK